jgi:hypothetical protein
MLFLGGTSSLVAKLGSSFNMFLGGISSLVHKLGSNFNMMFLIHMCSLELIKRNDTQHHNFKERKKKNQMLIKIKFVMNV